MISINKLAFSDSRLEFSGTFRFFWHLFQSSFYAFSTVVSVVFIFSGVKWLMWIGILGALFLIDRLLTVNKPAHLITDLKPELFEGINVVDYLSPEGFRVIEKSFDKTLIVGGNFYLHLLKILIKNKGIRGALWRIEVSPEEFEDKIDEEILKCGNKKIYKQEELLGKAENLAKRAFFEAVSARGAYVEPADILGALNFDGDEETKKIFKLFDADAEDLKKSLIFTRFRAKQFWTMRLPVSLGGFAHKPRQLRHRYMNRAWTAKPTPILDEYSIDFTDLAREGEVGFLIGHEKEYSQMIGILARPGSPNALLVGESGSGKETLIHRLAFEIVKDKVPQVLFDKRVVSLQIDDLISGADMKEISRRVKAVAEEITAAGNVILFIPNIHNVVKTQKVNFEGNFEEGGESGFGGSAGGNYIVAADIILPALKSGFFQTIGATYPRELRQNLESRGDFIGAFEIVRVEEISENEAIELLTYDSIILEREYGIIVSFKAIKQAVILAHKHFRQTLLPSSAENILREALAIATQNRDRVLKEDHIIGVCERKINVPIHKATKQEADNLLNLEEAIHKDLIDQEEAVKAVARSLREYRSGLSLASGPIASFLFVGPTGVGKTELAKILAKTQFGSEKAMIRFDMSEYQNKQSIFRFIGSPDGKMSGSLTETVIQKPYSLILLDEFEKANTDVLNLFLQVFDDGRLTDSLGRVADFKNTIIIATSNADSDYIKEQLEAGKEVVNFKDEFKNKLTAHFKPELLNRFSDVVVFKNLSQEDIFKIAGLQLKKLAETAYESQKITLEFSDDIVKYISEIGYDPVFGARPLRAAISDKIKSGLADKILRGEVEKGGKIKVEMEGDRIIFK